MQQEASRRLHGVQTSHPHRENCDSDETSKIQHRSEARGTRARVGLSTQNCSREGAFFSLQPDSLEGEIVNDGREIARKKTESTSGSKRILRGRERRREPS